VITQHWPNPPNPSDKETMTNQSEQPKSTETGSNVTKQINTGKPITFRRSSPMKAAVKVDTRDDKGSTSLKYNTISMNVNEKSLLLNELVRPTPRKVSSGDNLSVKKQTSPPKISTQNNTTTITNNNNNNNSNNNNNNNNRHNSNNNNINNYNNDNSNNNNINNSVDSSQRNESVGYVKFFNR
jgi:hypothetical protein